MSEKIVVTMSGEELTFDDFIKIFKADAYNANVPVYADAKFQGYNDSAENGVLGIYHGNLVRRVVSQAEFEALIVEWHGVTLAELEAIPEFGEAKSNLGSVLLKTEFGEFLVRAVEKLDVFLGRVR